MIRLKQTEIYCQWERDLSDKKARATVASRLFPLANGLVGDVSPIGEGISELRIHYGAGYPVYFQQRGLDIVLLLCAGNKSTQVRDIKRAKRLAQEWVIDEDRDI